MINYEYFCAVLPELAGGISRSYSSSMAAASFFVNVSKFFGSSIRSMPFNCSDIRAELGLKRQNSFYKPRNEGSSATFEDSFNLLIGSVV